MPSSFLQLLGFIGNIFLIIGYLPQIYKTFKSKKAEDVSIMMWLIFLIGEILLLIYAISIHDLNFIILLCIFAIGDIIIIGLKIKYGLSKNNNVIKNS